MRCWLRSKGALEPRGHISDQIRGIFDADGNPQQSCADAGSQARRLLHARVSHARRMRDEALHAAERLRESEAPEAAEEGFDRGLAPGQFEAQHRAEAAL